MCPPAPPERVEVIREQIRGMMHHVPPEFLKKCQWPKPLEGETQEHIDAAMVEMYRHAVDCYLLHNSWVEFHKEKIETLSESK